MKSGRYFLIFCIFLLLLIYVYAACKTSEIETNGTCNDPINTVISAEKNLFAVGETNKVVISADNTLNEDLNVKLTLNVKTGASLTGVISGSDCSGNQCTGVMLIPAKSRKSISVEITGESYGNVELKSSITSNIRGKEYSKQESVNVIVINPTDGICSTGETSRNACKDCGCLKDGVFYSYQCNINSCEKVLGWFVQLSIRIAIAVLVILIFLVWYFVIRKMPKKTESYLSRESERKKVVNALYKIQEEININDPPPLDVIIKKLKLDGNEDLIHEEYVAFLDRLEESRRKSIDAKFVKTNGASVSKLINFVKGELELGYNKEDIIGRAKWNNWTDSEIEKAFETAGVVELKRIPGGDSLRREHNYCTNCGALLNKEDKVCKKCGYEIK
ncbi:hypothetical protein HYX19_03995 [Candidatus Woesearchaeota archaeon]|nr:hypothetical protein [Candidatus Woesearchaeota archaeon]